MDLARIGMIAGQECERQQVGVQELGYLLTAYSNVVDIANDPAYVWSVHTFVALGKDVEPYKNYNGFRKTPVTFQNNGSSAPASEIPRLMNNLVESIRLTIRDRNENEVDSITREFLWIHPFKDGNGRAGWILYNYLMGTLPSPSNLPKYFGE